MLVTVTVARTRPLRRHGRVVERETRDRERRVAEPEAERVQRVARAQVAVARVVLLGHVAGTPGRLVVVVDRHLSDPLRERDRQLAARVDLPEDDVGDRVAGLDAREPGLEDRRRASPPRPRASAVGR